MLKHAFLVKWHRQGRTVTPILDAHAQCQWPLGPDQMDVASARAFRVMLDGLPKEVEQFMGAFQAMTLRLRYSNGDTTGPYVLNDVDERLDADTLDAFIQTCSDAELEKYLFRTGSRRAHK